jgi:two-component sensor histidine kinase
MTPDKDQRTAEHELEELRKSDGPFVVAAERTRMPMAFTNAHGTEHRLLFANDSFLDLLKFGRDELIGRPLSTLLCDDECHDAVAILNGAFENGEDELDLPFRTKLDRPVWVSLFISPVLDEEDKLAQHFLSFRDLTRHRRDQARTTALINELNHRVKNTLGTVHSIVMQALRRHVGSEAIRDAVESRLGALARAHDLLDQGRWTGAKIGQVVLAALDGKTLRSPEQIAVAGEDLTLPPRIVLVLSIALNELATNAARHGALKGPDGRLSVEWFVERVDAQPWLTLIWTERGTAGRPSPSIRGTGLDILERGLGYELRGTVTVAFHPAGLVCTVKFPLESGDNVF